MKRQRGRGRKPSGGGGGHHQPNRAMESNGPDIKVRGPANHIYERYQQLARDASSAGDRVMAENYLQHAEHYFRMWRALQPTAPIQPVHDRFQDGDYDEDGEAEGNEAEASSDGGEQPDVDFPQQQQHGGQDGQRGGDGDFRRRRGRRNRFRPDGERDGAEAGPREGGPREGGEPRETREPREAREPREPRERRGPRLEGEQRSEQREPRRPRREGGEDAGGGGEEGFSNGPRPAFLGSD